MTLLEPLLLLGLLILIFFLKLFVDRHPDMPDFLRAVFELPVDISFLSTTLIIAYMIAPFSDRQVGVLVFVGYIVVVVVAIVLWRRSVHLFEHGHPAWTVFLVFLNYLVSLAAIALAVALLAGGTTNAGV